MEYEGRKSRQKSAAGRHLQGPSSRRCRQTHTAAEKVKAVDGREAECVMKVSRIERNWLVSGFRAGPAVAVEAQRRKKDDTKESR